ncbi:MAG: hypothetical protein IT178_05450 [Acidobacteria bacterium]|nr:hypothetical protein [Acidobacteriota bacterium]
MKPRRWAPIVFGITVFVVFVGISVAVFGVVWVREHLQFEDMSPQRAEASFADIRQRHLKKAPLVEMRGSTMARRNEPDADAPRVRLSTIHMLAWDEDDQKLVQFELPFWILRLRSSQIRFGAYATGLDELGIALTADEIERYGPGIVIDVTREGRDRALVWVE